ncbi:M48 family metallopeptidase [Halapricum hydrolyticum]|uniref:M48 family metalloprotease n=1 Tax=Halapricum hydrolyticum TaxID=2979991 RepID=A0AAE3IGW1_9EURY|nr:M48 family metalloprotease [Halapricum hydrolyticum]MCU4719440.1 M48 family metalloprotease [Halapricum hydrolyticum]MCU4728449.1 M48 family metalloprotease [Halapricum hydrolyticum]
MSLRQPSGLRTHLRIVALVAVLLAFDVAFVAAVYVLAHVALALLPLVGYQFEIMTWALSFDIVPLEPVLLVGTPLVLLVQSVFGYRLTLREAREYDIGPDKELRNIVLADRSDSSDETDDEPEETVVAAPTLEDRVARLAQTADVTVPDVKVIDVETPNSYVASRPGERTLFLTVGLLEALSDDELDAVIAHELAHLSNGDAFVMTAAAFLPTVSGRFLDGLAAALRRSWLARKLFGLEGEQNANLSNLEIPLLLFTPVAVLTVGPLYLASTATYRLLSRIREYAADAGGVAISGSPAALASALEALTADPRPATDLRVAETGVRELCVLPYAMSDTNGETPDDVLGRFRGRCESVCERVLPGSHPDPNDRIAALRDRQAELEQ